LFAGKQFSASEMTYIVSRGALNCTNSTQLLFACWCGLYVHFVSNFGEERFSKIPDCVKKNSTLPITS